MVKEKRVKDAVENIVDSMYVLDGLNTVLLDLTCSPRRSASYEAAINRLITRKYKELAKQLFHLWHELNFYTFYNRVDNTSVMGLIDTEKVNEGLGSEAYTSASIEIDTKDKKVVIYVAWNNDAESLVSLDINDKMIKRFDEVINYTEKEK